MLDVSIHLSLPEQPQESPVGLHSIFDVGRHAHLCSSSGEQPFVCPDTTRVVDNLGSSLHPTVSETPCIYRAKGGATPIKHRRTYYGYKKDPERSQALVRRGMTASSQAHPRATASRSDTSTVPPNAIASSSNQASHPTFAPPPVGQSFDSNYWTTPSTSYGEAWNNISYPLSASSVNAQSSVASQNNYVYGSTAALPFPTLPNNPASVSRHNSNGSAHAYSALPYNSTFTRLPAGTSDTDLTHSASVSSYPNYGFQLAGSYAASAAAAVHFNSLYGEGWNNRGFAQESTIGTSAVVAQYNHADHGITTLPYPMPPNIPAAVSYGESNSESSSYVASNDPMYTSLNVSDATIACTADSTDLGSSTTNPIDVDSLPYASRASPPAPPSDHNNPSELDDDLYGDASNDAVYTSTPTVEPTEPSSPVISESNPVEGNATLPAPSSPPVQTLTPAETQPDANIDDTSEFSETEIGPGLLDFERELHEDDIFFRGTGREGCLWPEMMVDAGVEGWDKALLAYLTEVWSNYAT